ncbi:sigma-54-dependent Fis family transcriptional regulator [Pseudomonas sp. 5P_3.1_Bac2]|uniref:sigma-54-dependent Fis family transcriptional regulator n=1 Tax=Pseudomonas sp. 5P_3.1_Bac2 TaxID=2971617 RepID=UPI0021C64797|nr:sigma-54-dependent Fis family transcriptional regulator [Pseudomonas sp. 5P_3.1_Bac2]MCU1717948.1 sigma-54-dependent Fis family transcriptional regulator [Pseudomonas sp. 5P_3.1_Bac2]
MPRSKMSAPSIEEDLLSSLLTRKKRLLVNRTSEFRADGLPNAEDLADTVAFAPQDGFIWLCGQRMMLLQSSVFGAMRAELISSLGLEGARSLLTRLGWQSGARDAEQVAKHWPDGDHDALFSAGPRLHMLEGMMNVEAIRFEIDNGIGHFYSELLWNNSLEADEHLATYGLSDDAVCWMAIGYASGYASSLLGRLIVFREIECSGCGHSACRIVGKPANQWADVDPELIRLNAEAFFGQSNHPQRSPEDEALAPSIKTALSDEMVGGSSGFIAARQLLEKVAPTQATVLLTGESGVGKEFFARTLHQRSRRSERPWVALNCANLPENLVEAELFGVERGAFTGAERSRPGRFERADGGTLFLDEIGTLSASAQSKILRALQEGEIERVGGNAAIKVDVRVIAATHANLRAEVAAGRFREDLYYRLNVYPIHLPPLRERREDIQPLMNHFLQRFTRRYERNIPGFTTRLRNVLLTHLFPGNIRELQNLIERGVITCPDGEAMDLKHITLGNQDSFPLPAGLTLDGRLHGVAHAAEQPASTAAEPDLCAAENALDSLRAFVSGQTRELGTSLEEVELMLVRLALEKTDGNITAAAQMLGMSRAQVSYRIKPK